MAPSNFLILTNEENAETTFSPTAELVSSVVGMAVIGEAVEFDDEIEFPKSEGKSASKLGMFKSDKVN